MTLQIPHWAATHPGTVRTSNQDAYLCRPEIGLFAVADGVGGQAGGGHASAEIVRTLLGVPAGLSAPDLLLDVRQRLLQAHGRLLRDIAPAGGQAATTGVVRLLQGGHGACLWAGDSRAYVLRRDALHQITSDHSMVQEMVAAGTLTEAEAERHPNSNVITRAIGVQADGKLVEKTIGVAEPGDRFLLCSDGLSKTLETAQLTRLIGGGDPAQALVAAALARSVRDNVTALVLMVPETPDETSVGAAPEAVGRVRPTSR